MDGKTLEEIKKNLLMRWSRIESFSLQNLESQNEFLNGHKEMIDIAQGLEQLGREQSLQENERRELIAIERALSKMSKGLFGVCEECSEEIPSKRLLVIPEARLCTYCQTHQEKQNTRIKVSGGFVKS